MAQGSGESRTDSASQKNENRFTRRREKLMQVDGQVNGRIQGQRAEYL